MQSTSLIKASLLVRLCSLAGFANASDWVEVAGGDKLTIQIDRQSLQRNGDEIKVWDKWSYASPQQLEKAGRTKTYQTARNLVVYNCKKRTLKLLQSDKYADTQMGTKVDEFHINEVLADSIDLPPDSVGEAVFECVCQSAKPIKG